MEKGSCPSDRVPQSPALAGFEATRAFVAGDPSGVATGHKTPGSEVPMALGFDPTTQALRWSGGIADVDPALVEPSGRGLSQAVLLAGKVIAAYGLRDHSAKVIARDARSRRGPLDRGAADHPRRPR